MSEIPSKWEWIAEKLEGLGYIDEAAKARDIETVLKCLYGDDTRTEDWVSDIDSIETLYVDRLDKLESIIDVALTCGYCIACVKDEKCSDCRFGQISGICYEEGSLFRRFYISLKILHYRDS